MRDPNPTVILIPGLGMIAWGKDKSESRVTAEFYNCAIEVMRGAEAIDEYIALPQQEAFDIEYWLLEEAKLKRMPPEKELARQVIVVVGAGSGIGRKSRIALVKEGAHIVCVGPERRRRRGHREGNHRQIYGLGIGVAGSGISDCGPAVGLAGEHHRSRQHPRDAGAGRARLRRLRFDRASPPAFSCRRDTRRPHPRRKWALTFDINVTGGYLVADEARHVLERAGPARQPGAHHQRQRRRREKRFARLRHSKAAANHLVRELAIELAPLVRVNGSRPPPSSRDPRCSRATASSPRWRNTTSPSRKRRSDESLRDKLAQFYADRTLTKAPITPADQAEAAYFLLSDRSAKTTGQIITWTAACRKPSSAKCGSRASGRFCGT